MLVLALCLQVASAYETDPLSGLGQPLPDVTDALDAEVGRRLDEAIADVNRETKCRLPEDAARERLGKAFHHRVSALGLVWRHGPVRMWGYNRYGAWTETADLPRDDAWHRRDGLYADVRPWRGWVVWAAGPCSNVRLNGVRVGTDKLDHFFAEGFKAWRRGDFGADPEAGDRWSTGTESSIFGWWTSRAFGWADLVANHAGYHFFDDLLRPGSVVQRGDDGCLVRKGAFTWRNYVTPSWDEALNPSTYGGGIQHGVDRWMDAHQAAVCAGLAAEGMVPPDPRTLVVPGYVVGRTPARSDPFRLAERCPELVAR